MAPKTLHLSLLLPVLFSIATCLSSVEDPLTSGPNPGLDATRQIVRFFGPDFVPVPQERCAQSTVLEHITTLKGPIDQGGALDTIKSILAQHGITVKLSHAGDHDPISKNIPVHSLVGVPGQASPEQHAFAVTANHQADQKSILNSFAENQTVPFTTPQTSDGDDMPWFGDGFCCFEGCPPGSCPSIHVSTQTGDLFAVAQADTKACPCRGHGYCCCAGCPAGTCGAGGC